MDYMLLATALPASPPPVYSDRPAMQQRPVSYVELADFVEPAPYKLQGAFSQVDRERISRRDHV